jgi:hypothetical protein
MLFIHILEFEHRCFKSNKFKGKHDFFRKDDGKLS